MRTLELPQELPPWAPHLFMCSSDTDLRAVKFLFSLLTPEQIESLKMRGYFEHVTGGGTRCYLFSPVYHGVLGKFTGPNAAYFQLVSLVWYPILWGCVWTDQLVDVPDADSIATLLLRLKSNESAFCRMANWCPYNPAYYDRALDSILMRAQNARLRAIPILSRPTLDMEPVGTMTVPVEMRR